MCGNSSLTSMPHLAVLAELPRRRRAGCRSASARAWASRTAAACRCSSRAWAWGRTVDVRRAAGHEQEDHALRPRREHRRADAERVGRRGRDDAARRPATANERFVRRTSPARPSMPKPLAKVCSTCAAVSDRGFDRSCGRSSLDGSAVARATRSIHVHELVRAQQHLAVRLPGRSGVVVSPASPAPGERGLPISTSCGVGGRRRACGTASRSSPRRRRRRCLHRALGRGSLRLRQHERVVQQEQRLRRDGRVDPLLDDRRRRRRRRTGCGRWRGRSGSSSRTASAAACSGR